MLSGYSIRSASIHDISTLQSLINLEFFVHRHLDWNSPLDWVGQSPFLIMETEGKIIAALGCPEGPSGIHWIHLFCNISSYHPREIWPVLFSAAWNTLKSTSTPLLISAISLQPWFTSLLENSNFHHFQDIVVLEKEFNSPKQAPTLPPGISIRPMELTDLPRVVIVDRRSFHPLWHNSFEIIQEAWKQSTYSTVAEFSGELIGYQICTSSSYNAHLARLAVLPEFQRMGIGTGLIVNLENHFIQDGLSRLTVNTQSDNLSSLSLYRNCGFYHTGESYPVLVYSMPSMAVSGVSIR